MHFFRPTEQLKGLPASICVVVCVLFSVLPGCSREKTSMPYVARVGSVALTHDDLYSTCDSLVLAQRRSRAFVNEWVVNELLYQEAQRRGMTDTDQLRKQLEATRKRLAIESLLDKEVYTNPDAQVSDKEVTASFTKNASLFTLHEDVLRLSYAQFVERDAAIQFRALVLRGTTWDDAINQARHDTINNHLLRSAARNQYFTQETLYPEELWKLARTLPKEEISYAVKTGNGYYVVMVHGLKRIGEIPEFDYAKAEVRDRLLIERRRTRYEQFVTELRTKYRVDINFDDADSIAGSTE